MLAVSEPCGHHWKRYAAWLSFGCWEDPANFLLSLPGRSTEDIWESFILVGTQLTIKVKSLLWREKKKTEKSKLNPVGIECRWMPESKVKLNGIYCSETILSCDYFSTFARRVTTCFRVTVLVTDNGVIFIPLCRITWKYSLECISHWVKVKKQSRHVANSKVPYHLAEI